MSWKHRWERTRGRLVGMWGGGRGRAQSTEEEREGCPAPERPGEHRGVTGSGRESIRPPSDAVVHSGHKNIRLPPYAAES